MDAYEQDLVSLDELRSMLTNYSGPDEPRCRPARGRWQRRRLGLFVALAAVALAASSIAVADQIGAFNGIGAAQHPQTGADLLDPKTLAGLQNACPNRSTQTFYRPFCHLMLDSTRLVGQVQPYGNVYVITDTRGDLCAVLDGGDGSCGPPLSQTHPITFGSFNRSPTTGGTYIATGLAIDGVTAVSFTLSGKPVEALVSNNVWIYSEPNSHATEARCILAHLSDGSTVNAFPGSPCP